MNHYVSPEISASLDKWERMNGKWLRISPGLHYGLTPQEMIRIVGNRGEVHFQGRNIDSSVHYTFAIKTDDPDGLKQYFVSRGIHSDGSFGCGYW